ncbi:MAG: peptidoglycan-binding protein [Ilumatobacteraceae bacterium]
MPTTTSSHRHLRTVGSLVIVAVIVAGVYLVRHTDEPAPTVKASIFKTVTVEQGNLGTTEQIDGSVVLSDVTTVLHRIEGQTSSSPGTSAGTGDTASTGGSGPPAAGLTSATIGLGANTEAAGLAGCDTPAGPTPSTPSGSDPAPATTTTDLLTTTTTEPTPTTGPDAGPPDTMPVGTTAPTSSVPAATPTTDCTTATTIADGGIGGAPTGGAPTGGAPTGGAPTGGLPTGGSTVGGSTGSTARVTQLVTSVIPAGSTVVIGTVLYSVESQPVVALAGSLPAWRALDTSSDDGTDILQLEMNLVALGYDPGATMTVDTHYDSHTKAVVKAWQAGYGMEVTGAVALGSVVFVRTQADVSSVNVAVGDAVGDGDSVLTLSASSQQVVIDVPDGDEAYLVPGLTVKIGSVEGKVTLLHSIERDNAVVVQAVITPAGTIDGAGTGQTVSVTVTVTNLDGALTVPTEALVSRIDGSYALQVLADDGSSSFLVVELLGVSGATAAVRGDGLTAGTKVLQPL